MFLDIIHVLFLSKSVAVSKQLAYTVLLVTRTVSETELE
jgi:hypothetical protein